MGTIIQKVVNNLVIPNQLNRLELQDSKDLHIMYIRNVITLIFVGQ